MANVVMLPAEGRKGRAPRWPLKGEPTDAQAELWRQLWRTPQAVAWERFEWTRVVARYVVLVLLAEDSLGWVFDAAVKVAPDVKFLAEARQLEDRLGLTPMAMLRLRWEVTAPAEGKDKRPEQAPAGNVSDIRSRFQQAQ
jgi:hypothetical protein